METPKHVFERDESKSGKRFMFVMIIVLIMLTGFVVYELFKTDLTKNTQTINSPLLIQDQ